MNKAILTIGAPASGKSTWAREQAALTGAVIIERDIIRATQGFTYDLPKEQIKRNEDKVTKIQRGQIEAALTDGFDVIVADTNINNTFRNRLVKFIHQLGYDVEFVTFTDVSLDELIMRDAARANSVGADVVQRMFEQIKNLPDLPPAPVQRFAPYKHVGPEMSSHRSAYVIDLDGTVALGHNHRSPYDYSKVIDDEPFQDVIDVVKALSNRGQAIIAVSGRDDTCKADTSAWLGLHGITVSGLYMRKAGDQRPDWVIKNEIYDKYIIPYFNIKGVFDDRDQVVKHLRARGITVFQVNYGRF